MTASIPDAWLGKFLIGRGAACMSWFLDCAQHQWGLSVPISVREAVRMISSENVLAKSMVPSWPHFEKKSCSGHSSSSATICEALG